MANRTMAVCTTASWTFNSLNQSPCVVGSALAGVCVRGDFTLTALEPDYVYLGPSSTSATPCRCNSVYYSLLSACAVCQDRSFIRWSRYSANCTTVYAGVYPSPIPASVRVPHYAYLDVEAGDTFNVTLAQAATGPESTAVRPTSSTRATLTSTSSGGISTTGPVLESSSGKSNTGAIVGGVVGGIVGLAALGLIAFFLLRRKKNKKTPPSAVYGAGATAPPPMSYTDGSSGLASPKPYNPQEQGFPYPQAYSPPPQNQYYGQPQPQYGQQPQPYLQPQPGYLPPQVTGQSANSGYTYANTLVNQPGPPTPAGQPARYTGAPEL